MNYKKVWADKEIDTTPNYTIEHVEELGWVLYSIVPTNFGGDAKNFICAGTKEYCEQIKERMEKDGRFEGLQST